MVIKMKKVLVALLSICILVSVLAGCSSSSKSTDSASYNGYAPAPSATPKYDSDMAPTGPEYSEDAYKEMSSVSNSGVMVRASSTTFEKIIYTADAEIETVDFDKSVSDVYTLLDA